jgi:hypothetical protein
MSILVRRELFPLAHLTTAFDGPGSTPEPRTVTSVALKARLRQVGNILFGLVIAAIGLITLVTASSTPGRIFDGFVLLVGLAAVYLAVRAMRRRV